MLYPDWFIIWLAIVGGCALILGVRRLGLLLVMPAAIRFVVLPVSAPVLLQATDGVPALVFLITVPIVVVFGGILLLQSLVRPVYGHTAAGYVAGNYLVRAFDSIGRGIAFVLTLPFRLLRRHSRQ